MAIDEAETMAADLASVPDSLPGSSGSHRLIARGDTVGRYVMITRLGAGTMGEVWAAYDPELDRKLAVKLLHPQRRDSGDARRHQRMLREAQALAKLSHPNVVAIHDVGTIDGMVWLAMEFVEGETLRAWSKSATRSWQEVLDVMLAAGRGLVAAHTAGLVHRDVKPENIMVGSGPDGAPRVRVMDFGLVRAELDRASSSDVDAELASSSGARPLALELTMSGGVVGTPAYMAPEQQIDPRTDARGDQFGFCVTMWECLFGQRPFRGDTLPALASAIARGEITPPPADRPAPAWLRKVCERGFAARADHRWSSMAELLDALARGRTRGRSRRVTLAVAGVAIVGVAALGVHMLGRRAREQACERAAAAIDATWTDDVRAQLQHALATVGTSASAGAAERVPPLFDAWTDTWRSVRLQTCRAHAIAATWDDALAQRADECLAERRASFAALVDQLAHADADVAERAVPIAAGLELATACGEARELLRRPRSLDPDDPRRATLREVQGRSSTLARAGRATAAAEVAAEALALAIELDDVFLIAGVRLQLANALEATARLPEAEAEILTAYREAGSAGIDDLEARAATMAMIIVGVQLGRVNEGFVWAHAAEVAALRVEPEQDGGRTAELQYALANLYLETSDLEQARTAVERAFAIRERLFGAQHPTTVSTLSTLGVVRYQSGDVRGALADFERVLALREEMVGPEHNVVGRSAVSVANAWFGLGDYEQAIAMHRRAVAIFEHTLPPRHPDLGIEQINLATVLTAGGHLDEARSVAEPAVAALESELGAEHPDVVHGWFVLAQVHLAAHRYELAEPIYRRTLAAEEKVLATDHPEIAHTLLGLGSVALARDRFEEAEAAFTRARGIFVRTLGESHRELASVEELLGQLAQARGRPDDAAAHLRRGLAVLDAAGLSGGIRERIQARIDALPGAAQLGG